MTNFIGSIALRVNGIETPCEYIATPLIEQAYLPFLAVLIAEGFNLTDGHINVVAPLVDETADFYSLVCTCTFFVSVLSWCRQED